MSQHNSNFSYDEFNKKDPSEQFRYELPDFDNRNLKNDDSIDNNIDARSNKDEDLEMFLGDQYDQHRNLS